MKRSEQRADQRLGLREGEQGVRVLGGVNLLQHGGEGDGRYRIGDDHRPAVEALSGVKQLEVYPQRDELVLQ